MEKVLKFLKSSNKFLNKIFVLIVLAFVYLGFFGLIYPLYLLFNKNGKNTESYWKKPKPGNKVDLSSPY